MNKRNLLLFVGIVAILGVCTLWPMWEGASEVTTERTRSPSDEFLKGNLAASRENSMIEPQACEDFQVIRGQQSPGGVQTGNFARKTVTAVLANVHATVSERVQQIQLLRGVRLSEDERVEALAFFAGKNVPAGLGEGSVHWLADELMTVMRLQVPPQEDLAAELGEIAFRPETDPVVRDYIMQHLGHLWEQFGAREIIEESLWRAVACSDQTTPGSALIALSRGYERDPQPENLEKVRAQALVLLKDPATGLAVRVTALAIAGDGASQEVKALARELAQNAETPLILKRVAERIVGK
jgi:hypothetical protein